MIRGGFCRGVVQYLPRRTWTSSHPPNSQRLLMSRTMTRASKKTPSAHMARGVAADAGFSSGLKSTHSSSYQMKIQHKMHEKCLGRTGIKYGKHLRRPASWSRTVLRLTLQGQLDMKHGCLKPGTLVSSPVSKRMLSHASFIRSSGRSLEVTSCAHLVHECSGNLFNRFACVELVQVSRGTASLLCWVRRLLGDKQFMEASEGSTPSH